MMRSLVMRKLTVSVGGVLLAVAVLEGFARLAERWIVTDDSVQHHQSMLASGKTLLPAVEFNLPGLAVVDATLGYRLRPGASLPGDIHVNAQGFRGPQVAIAKPAETYRILALGDSTTFGIGSGEEDTYPRLLQRQLEQRCVPALAKRIEVINGGVPGYTSTQIVRNLETTWLAYQPDLVLVMQGLNDLTAHFLWGETAEELQGQHGVVVSGVKRAVMRYWAASLTHSALARWLHRLVARQMLVSMLKSNAAVWETHPSAIPDHADEIPVPVRRQLEDNLDHLAQLSTAARFDLAILRYPGIWSHGQTQHQPAASTEASSFKRPVSSWEVAVLQQPDVLKMVSTLGIRVWKAHESVADLQKQWALHRGVSYVDLRAAFDRNGSGGALYVESRIHFSPAGNAVIAEEVAATLFGQRCPASDEQRSSSTIL